METVSGVIQEAYEHPTRRGSLSAATHCCSRENAFCGDSVEVRARVEEGRIVEAAFDGRGCALSQACAELLLDEVVGMDVPEVRALQREALLHDLGLEAIAPSRRKCALLAFEALACALAHEG